MLERKPSILEVMHKDSHSLQCQTWAWIRYAWIVYYIHEIILSKQIILRAVIRFCSKEILSYLFGFKAVKSQSIFEFHDQWWLHCAQPHRRDTESTIEQHLIKWLRKHLFTTTPLLSCCSLALSSLCCHSVPRDRRMLVCSKKAKKGLSDRRFS